MRFAKFGGNNMMVNACPTAATMRGLAALTTGLVN
jgi:hypothetical protein